MMKQNNTHRLDSGERSTRLPGNLQRFPELLQGASQIAEQSVDPTSQLALPAAESLIALGKIVVAVREIDTYFSDCRAQVEENLSSTSKYGTKRMWAFDFTDPITGSILAQIALNRDEPLPLRIPALQILKHYPETICCVATELINLLDDPTIVDSRYVSNVLRVVGPRIESEMRKSFEGADKSLRVGIYQALGFPGWRLEFAVQILYQGLAEMNWTKDYAVRGLEEILNDNNYMELVIHHNQHATEEVDQRPHLVATILAKYKIDDSLHRAKDLKLRPQTIKLLEDVLSYQRMKEQA